MKRRELEKQLKRKGFKKLRQTKHIIYSNGERKIVVPGGSDINDRLAKEIILQMSRPLISQHCLVSLNH
jgi:predicted RNA binding protein YcfA (HicA-like mRNA interferase family)